jgi:hypothetical protein
MQNTRIFLGCCFEEIRGGPPSSLSRLPTTQAAKAGCRHYKAGSAVPDKWPEAGMGVRSIEVIAKSILTACFLDGRLEGGHDEAKECVNPGPP